MSKKVLVVGGGGRCHAIVDALSKSTKVTKIYCAPGNAGIAKQAELVPLKDTDVNGLLAFAQTNAIDLTVVGPEASLALGIVDLFKAHGLRIFGPTKQAAQIESSKQFAKDLMIKYDIPTAAYQTFSKFVEAFEYVKTRPLPAVLKYDGLAAGKGVVIAETLAEAELALKDMLVDDKFGQGKVVIEDFLEGPEFSYMCFVSGAEVYPMVLAQDHKRAYDGDTGPNTGGMGAYGPLPFITKDDEAYALEHILKPTAKAMISEGVSFSGVLYGGLMKTKNGIKVIEFNARFGDPETEVVLPRLKSDIYDLFCGIADETPIEIEWNDTPILGIVMASKGYPGDYEKGHEIKGTEHTGALVYHMGTTEKDGKLLTAGGRVLMVVGQGKDLNEARANALSAVSKIECGNLFYRTDIGDKR
ncbi:MAG: phosphoribosylamine--glycine ligase [Bacteroidales bacterium]|jgi:phosphoribosylamine--glycine ligase|nr:phosphoribosylamine--glycine ligase [Bacteroidales bacterium]